LVAWDDDYERDALAEALGTDNSSGFHIEIFYQTSPFWEHPRRGDGTRFPCIDAENVYSGCLGSACTAARCWAGRLVASAANAPTDRIALPHLERRGAVCHLCIHAVDREDGMVDCAKGHFDRPITSAGLVRRRVPDSAPIPCPDLVTRDEPRPDVLAYRAAKRRYRDKAVGDD
jgi:hypothetical protein